MTKLLVRSTLAATLLVLAGVASPLTRAGAQEGCPRGSAGSADDAEVLPGSCWYVPKDEAVRIAEYIWNYAVDAGLIVHLGDSWVPFTLDAHDWGRLAHCESGGRWATETGNGYSGGLQILPSTWVGAGGLEFAPRPSLASAEEQIEVGRRIVNRSGWGQFPACARLLSLR